jgi:hypothetical protein
MASRLQGAQFAFMDAIAHCLDFLGDEMRDSEMLRRGLQQAESAGFVYMLARAGSCLPILCDRALEQKIHVAFVRRLIATNKLLPPAGASPHWPWPVRIRTLGGFSLEVNDEPYHPSRKAQDKPLELLKLLVCCQAMHRNSADKQWLAQRLWPDADEANARKSLDMTLSRLRRLLGDDATIVASESRLAFSATHVWTDIAPLLDALSRVSEFRDRHAGGRAPRGAAPSADVAAMLEHFKGPFLPEDEGPSRAAGGARGRVAAVRSALLIAESLFEGNRPQVLAALDRAFSAIQPRKTWARADALVDPFRQHAEALRVYRRLREMLSSCSA